MKQDWPPRNPNKVLYPAVDKCIYCGAREGRLTDEHIIPFSLGGILVLPKASCGRCAKITSNFEGAFARSLFGEFRMRHKLPTRRPKERPTHVVVGRIDDPHARVVVPVSEFPAPAYMYKYTKPGILAGLLPEHDTSGKAGIIAIVSDAEMKSFRQKYGETTYRFRHMPEQFAKSLAKMGYSYAVAHFGLDAFRPLAVDVILGRAKNFSYLVGGSFDVPPPVPDAGHLLELNVVTDPQLRRALVVVDLRLFASAGTPQYQVVVGASDDADMTRKLIERCGPI